MAKEYQFQAGEVELLRANGVKQLGRQGALFSDDLILTNMNLYHISNAKNSDIRKTNKYCLENIKLKDGIPQVRIEWYDRYSRKIDILTNEGHLTFVFSKVSQETSELWKDKIIVETVNRINAKVNPTVAELAGTTENSGITPKSVPVKRNIINAKCISCKAPLYGITYTVVKCDYCDSEQILKDEDDL